MGMIEGVSRPALAAILPNVNDHTLLLDVGANVDAKPNHLREFAVMGHFYAQMVFGIEAPRIGLLSIGEEEGKGNELTKETFRVLKETGLNFIGNAEGRDIYNGNTDVVVCDGFIGNVVLKASEALGEMVSTLLRDEMTRSLPRKVGTAGEKWLRRPEAADGLLRIRRCSAPRCQGRMHRLPRALEREGDQECDPRSARFCVESHRSEDSGEGHGSSRTRARQQRAGLYVAPALSRRRAD